MRISASKINLFLLFKLPSAFFCGVRVSQISGHECVVSVKHRWINQNPFNCLYFAVQAMSAELSTGVLVNLHVENSGKKISMLLVGNKAKYMKRAVGRITFVCREGNQISEVLQKASLSGEGQTFWLKSIGTD